MKKRTIFATMMLLVISASAAQAQDWKDALSKATETLIGDKITTASAIQGKWDYTAPDCQLTSDDVVSKLGGEAISASMEKELKKVYSKMKMDKMVFTFNADSTYSCKSDKVTTTGTYTFDKETKTMQLKTKLGMKFNANVAVIGNKMSLTFKADKLLKILSSLSGFASEKLGKTGALLDQLLKNYDGMNVGFQLAKTGDVPAGNSDDTIQNNGTTQKGGTVQKGGSIQNGSTVKKDDSSKKDNSTKKESGSNTTVKKGNTANNLQNVSDPLNLKNKKKKK